MVGAGVGGKPCNDPLQNSSFGVALHEAARDVWRCCLEPRPSQWHPRPRLTRNSDVGGHQESSILPCLAAPREEKAGGQFFLYKRSLVISFPGAPTTWWRTARRFESLFGVAS